MSRRGENIYFRKDKRWEGRFRKEDLPSGKSHYGYVYGKSYSEVKDRLNKERAKWTEQKSRNSKVTVTQAASYWLQRQKFIVKESSFATYKTIVHTHILPCMGDALISQISVERLDSLVLEKLNCGRKDGAGGLSSKYVRDILMVLRSILKLAGQVYGCPIPYRLSGLPRPEIAAPQIMSDVERSYLEQLTFSSLDYRQQGIFLCLYTGLRIGELCALRWSDFNKSKSILYVRRTLQRIQDTSGAGAKTKIILTEPKSRTSTRQIPIPDFLAQHLCSISQSLPPDSYLLTGSMEHFMEPRGYQDFFHRFLKRNNLQIINFHTLRHTFATRCIQLGFDPKSLSELLGHASVEITLNRYVHMGFETKKHYMERLVPPQ